MNKKPEKPEKSENQEQEDDKKNRNEKKGKSREDTNLITSKLPGIWGFVEKFLRKFRFLSFYLLLIPISFCYIICLALALFPPLLILLFTFQYAVNHGFSLMATAFWLSLAMGVNFLLFIMTLSLAVIIFNFPFLFLIGPMRGTWFSVKAIPWYYHNALLQLARYTVLDFLAPTPLLTLFYRGMGMKVGKNVMINTTNISDPALITLGDHVMIGGSATIFAHYAMGGYLIISTTHIKNGVTIGLKASIMGNVVIGENVIIRPNEVVLPKSRIPAKVIKKQNDQEENS
jgi:acetyltransferase-like isoleucine patch superfamily enzyme